jgi:hypothetical protein
VCLSIFSQMDSKENNNNKHEPQIETNEQQQQQQHNLFYLRIAYFTTFLARGSLLPFLGVILRARGSSYLLIGITMNISAITRLVASSVFASMSETSTTKNNSQQNVLLDLSKRVILVCLSIAMVASTIFSLSPSSPSISAISVATLLCASSISSLALDSVAIKLFSQQTHDEEEVTGEDVESSSAFGKVRLFGSLGWGIAAPLQVLLMTLIYNNSNDKTTSFNKKDLHAWFPAKNVTGRDNNNSPLLATNFIFLVGFCVFLFSVQRLKSSSTSTETVVDEVRELETVTSNNQRNEETSMVTTTTTETAQEDEQEPRNSRTTSYTLFQLIWALRYALLFTVLYGLCDDVVGTFFFPFLRKELNVSSTIISIIPTINVVSELPVLAMSKWFHKNYSIATLHLVFISLWAVRFSWYAFVLVSSSTSSSPEIGVNNSNSGNQTPSSTAQSNFFFLFKILIVETLNGLCFVGAFVLCMRHAVWIATKEIFVDVQRAVPLVHSSFFGVSSIIGGLCGGFLAEYFGVRMLFALMAMVCFFIACGLFMRQLFVKIV